VLLLFGVITARITLDLLFFNFTEPMLHYSATQQLTIGNGIVFDKHQQNLTINRDYDQTAQIWVTNQDNQPHEVYLEIQEEYEDLIVNFRGSGSVDGAITLLPGESRAVELAIFAQDAALHEYTLNAVLTSNDGTTTINDFAAIDVQVLFEADYSLTETNFDPLLNTKTYRITNHGQPITDLYVRAVDPVTNLPAQVYITPQIFHARLGTGEFLEFKVIPLYNSETSTQATGSSSPLKVLASPAKDDSSAFDLITEVGKFVQRHQAQQSCGGGRSVYAVTLSNVVLEIPFQSWYCTNRPNIDISINLPPFVNPANLMGATLEMGIMPQSDAQLHDSTTSFNGEVISVSQNEIPNGAYSYSIDPSFFRTNPFEGASQTINLRTIHPNQGHYVSQVGGTLHIALNEVTLYVCAFSQAEAEQLAMDAYGFIPLPENFNIDIAKPTTTGTVEPEEDGSINIRAYLNDGASSYVNFYRVEAEIEYLDVLLTPTEKFLLFDDGITAHGDQSKNDRLFNSLWVPQHGGNIQLTVTATMPDGRVDTDVRTFHIDALPDLAVTRVFIEDASLLNNARVRAEITNLGFTITGPVNVDFVYYATDANGNKIGVPLHVSHLQILTGQPGQPVILTRGSKVEIEDTQFTPDEISLYFVEVVVDP
jgi:hypothetical protein